ncbi:hypothetical protein [Myxosarcina sp. GI1]|nr:hypothetical protein [Myxosarcina sp. GI1]
MSRIRFYLDRDAIESALVKALQNADLDLKTLADINMLSSADREIY